MKKKIISLGMALVLAAGAWNFSGGSERLATAQNAVKQQNQEGMQEAEDVRDTDVENAEKTYRNTTAGTETGHEVQTESVEIPETESESEQISDSEMTPETEETNSTETNSTETNDAETNNTETNSTEINSEPESETASETISESGEETEGLPETEPKTEQYGETEWMSEEFEESEEWTETEEICTCERTGEEAFFHMWDCPVFEQELQRMCDCGDGSGILTAHGYDCTAVLNVFGLLCSDICGAYTYPASFHGDCPVIAQLLKFICTCGSEEYDFENHAENCEYFLYMFDCTDFYNSQIEPLLEYNLPASGTSVTAAGSGFTKAPAVITSPDFRPVKFYPGISSAERFTSANVSVGKTSSGLTYMYPKNAKAKGSFGVRYRKVLHYNNEWYDVKMTVQDFSEKTYVNGGGTVTSRPFIVFYENKIGWGFNERMGELILKIDFVRTGTDTPAPVNARFQWWDIDSAQRFGIRLGNGSFASRYYSASGSAVNYQTGKVAGDSNNYFIYIGQGPGLNDSDQKGHLTFELSKCSTYYMAFAYQDHLKDSDDYRNYKSSIEKWNTMMAAGQTYGSGNGESVGELIQTDTSLSVIDTPAPVKYVSNTASGWTGSNILPKKDAEYYYMIEQFVPWNDISHRYKTFQIKDTLSAGVDYGGSLSIVRVEDNIAVTDKFQISTTGDVMTVTATDAFKNGASYYGYTYRIIIKVRMDPTEISPQEDGASMKYQVTNKAALTYENTGAMASSKETNTVTTTAVTERSVRLYLTKANAQTKETISNAEFRVYEWDGYAYTKDRGALTWDEDQKHYFMEKLTRSSVNGGKYKVVETKVPPGHIGSWEQEVLVPETDGVVDIRFHVENKMSKGTFTIHKESEDGEPLAEAVYEIRAKENICSAQGKILVPAGELLETVTTGEDGSVVSGELYPGKYLITEVKAPPGYRLNKTPQEAEIVWKDAGTPITNTEVKFVNTLVWTEVALTKEIDAEDIVWAHGNPVFTFRLSGTDVFGEEHEYYDIVEFTKENCPVQGKTQLTVHFRIMQGNYTATEEPVMRYEQGEIHSVSGGSVTGGTVVFEVKDEKDRSAVFYNRKVTDQDESHTAFVRNEF